MPELDSRQDGAVLTLTLNREAQRNSLSAGLVSELLAGLKAAESAESVRLVILTGAGNKAFCAGGDLASGATADGFLAGHEGRRRYGTLLAAMANFEKPLVGRINGLALAGGLGLVCACDLAIAADDTQFGTPEVNVGLFPYMVTALLFRAIGPKHAMELVLTGKRVSAAEAASIGLINRAVPRASLDDEIGRLATELASKSPAILRLGKRAIQKTRDIAIDPALELLAAQLSVNSLTEDAMEGITSFLEKRPPEWKGR